MLCEEDLNEISQFFNSKLQTTKDKIKGERNAKIVNYKIRSFIEKIRDKLKRFEPVTFIDGNQTVVNKASQMDRIEMTIGQVLNQVQKLQTGLDTLENLPSKIEHRVVKPIENPIQMDQEAPQRQRSDKNLAQQMQQNLETLKVNLNDLVEQEKPLESQSQ